MEVLFMPNNEHTYSLRHLRQFKRPVNALYRSTESASFLGAKIWKILPGGFKKINYIDIFIKAIKTWRSSNYPCRLCSVHVQNIGFLCSLEL